MNNYYMSMALELARQAQGRTSPNPVVGAVIVKNAIVQGTGYHQKAGTPHAEVHALRAAGMEAQDADMYVTLEPCNHTGRTPPCTEAIINAGIKRVFIATLDPNPIVSGRGVARLQAAGIETVVGILEDKARRLNETFNKYIRQRLPFVALKVAQSLDGKMATATGESQWITGEAARHHGHGLRNIYDAILVGIGTVMKDNPSLTCRLPAGSGRDPVRIIVDSRLSITKDARVLQLDSTASTIIATTASASPDKISIIEKKAPVLIVNDGPFVHLPSLMKKLAEVEITSVLVEGGSHIISSFLEEKLIDKYYFYIAPKIIGNVKSPGPFDHTLPVPLAQVPELINLETLALGKDLLVSGYPDRKEE